MISYKLRVLSGVRLEKIFKAIDKVHEKSGKNKLSVFFDMINCAVRYGAGYNDYLIFAFYDMDDEHRKTYVTRFINKKIISKFNDDKFSYVFDEKNVFNKRFKKYLRREYVDVKTLTFDQFKKFMQDKEIVFAKPNTGVSGKGIERLKKSDFESLESLYKYVKNPDKDFGVVEQELIQHEDLSRLYPLAINSLRIVTMVIDGKAYCCYVTSKMGNDGKFVDNLESRGLCCPVDIKTGKIYSVAHTSRLEVFEKHPYTGIKFDGYQLPYVKEAIDMCLEAAMEVDEIKFVGWDVCITKDGPAIIEGNDYPGYDFWQLPEHTPDKIGLLPYYKKLIPGL